MRARFIAAAVFLLILQLVVQWVRQGYSMGEILPPPRPLEQLPLQLGDWTGEDVEQDPQLQGRLQAMSGVDRTYRDPAGNEVYLHLVWTDDYVRIHFPHQCYRESGWTETQTRKVEILAADGKKVAAPLVDFSRDAERLQVLYLFQMGDRLFFDRVQHRVLRQELCWGRKQWPPLVKLMVQTSAFQPEQSEARLKEVAQLVLAWLSAPPATRSL